MYCIHLFTASNWLALGSSVQSWLPHMPMKRGSDNSPQVCSLGPQVTAGRTEVTVEMDQSSSRFSDAMEEMPSVGSSEEEDSDDQSQCLAAPPTLPQNYKQRSDELRKLFKEKPESDRLLVDYHCALQRDILLQGRLYLTENWLCFHSNVFKGTKILLPLKDITSMTKMNTARFIPNAIQVCTTSDKLFLTFFSSRAKSYQNLFRMWQNILLKKVDFVLPGHIVTVGRGNDM
ncbi:GRAM domain-containing protein 1B [Merluccius polli]|uniref:GRAM domain-containing protein 1B n=1 Tax=Merluccius polli TaxID=89951 RepID=A0AA47M6K3_MERPO|nr:GRAM domain-containing protein 1B [Merluccius polli]